jgi:hypothetical protein
MPRMAMKSTTISSLVSATEKLLFLAITGDNACGCSVCPPPAAAAFPPPPPGAASTHWAPRWRSGGCGGSMAATVCPLPPDEARRAQCGAIDAMLLCCAGGHVRACLCSLCHVALSARTLTVAAVDAHAV